MWLGAFYYHFDRIEDLNHFPRFRLDTCGESKHQLLRVDISVQCVSFSLCVQSCLPWSRNQRHGSCRRLFLGAIATPY